MAYGESIGHVIDDVTKVARSPVFYGNSRISGRFSRLPFDTNTGYTLQGRSDGGGYRYLYPLKSAQANFLWGKMTSEQLFNSFIHPQKLLYPPKQISGYAPDTLSRILTSLNFVA